MLGKCTKGKERKKRTKLLILITKRIPLFQGIPQRWGAMDIELDT
jgi:hypothetical protein